ncbi:MAG: outer membrane beta-barrel protein [Chitinophagales bacterium]|nr:outer membrane beta-barrel protein [Chitinophagales bacterium]
MKKYIGLLFFTVFLSGLSFAQNSKGSVSGILLDSADNHQIAFATVTIFSSLDTSLVTYRISSPDGKFKVPGLPLNISLRAIITFSGYKVYRKEFTLSPAFPQLELGTIRLEPASKTLDEILMYAERPPMSFRKDTIEFNASAFTTLPTALLEDLLRKLPGVSVNSNGTIVFNGRSVNRILVDGKEFFGRDPKIATQNLPANIIDKIQVVDDKEQLDRDPFISTGELGQVINLKLKKGIKKGWFGKVYAGAGTDEKYEAGGIANLFRDTLQVSILGYTNTLNRAGFGLSDISQIGGFDRSGTNSTGGNNDGGLIVNDISFGGTGQGLQRSTGGGINLNHQPTSKLTFNLQYFYGNIRSEMEQINSIDQFVNDTILRTFNKINDNRTEIADRIGSTLRWQLNPLASLEIRPGIILGSTSSVRSSLSDVSSNKQLQINKSNNAQQLEEKSNEYSFNTVYSQRFRKKGRSLYFSGTVTRSENDVNQFNQVSDIFYTPVADTGVLNQLRARNMDHKRADIAANYNEPLGKKVSLILSENTSYQESRDVLNTFFENPNSGQIDFYTDSLSNGLRRNILRSQTSLSVKYTNKKFTFSPNLGLLILNINNRFQKQTSLIQHYLYLVPSLNIRYGIVNFNYRVSVTEPVTTDVYPVVDNTNTVFQQVGNPTLKPTVYHLLGFNIYKFNVKKRFNYRVFTNTVFMNNAVIRERFIDDKGVQTLHPINTDGTWRSSVLISFEKQVKFTNDLQFRFGMSFMGTYNRGIVSINNVRTKNDAFAGFPSMSFSFNWRDKIEINQRYNPSLLRTSYQGTIPDISTVTHSTETELVFRMRKRLALESLINYNFNSQVPDGLSKSIVRWNLGLTYQFLKEERGQLKISAYDLLNQNSSIYQVVRENFTQSTQTNALTRYFLLTFSYNLTNFRTKAGGKDKMFYF